jgi:hypothetical protein
LQLPSQDRVPCLVETDPEDLARSGCRIWAPRWTRGVLSSEAQAVQDSGGLVAFWTLDDPTFIDTFLKGAPPNAILTNRPGLVRHRFEMVGTVPAAVERP